MIKKSPLLLVIASMLSSFVLGVNVNNSKEIKATETHYSDLLKSKPGMINGNYSYNVVGSFTYEPNSVGYYNIADSTTQSITYGFGIEEGGIGTALYLETPGGNFDTLMRLRTPISNDLSSSEGFMCYVDLSEIKAEEGNYVGLGVGLVMMDTVNEPPAGNSLWEESYYGGHFNHYYPLSNKLAYYYDLHEGRFVGTSIIDKCVVLQEGYEGWIYVPLSSYGWNGNSDAKYMMSKDAFDNGYNWLIYTHIVTRNFKHDDTQSKIYVDEYNFIKKKSLVTPDYVFQYDLNPTCDDIGGAVYKESNTESLRIQSVVPHLEHDYEYRKFKSGAIGVCSHCEDLVYTEDEAIVNAATNGDTSQYVDLHFHYGKDLEKEEIRIINKWQSLPRNKEPHISRILKDDGWEYDFSIWSNSLDKYVPTDPKEEIHLEETHYYAKYLISSYDNIKYSHVPNLLAMHGGRYHLTKGKIVMNGNSNFSLAYNTESDFAVRGLPLINNACAGGSTYDYYYYAEQLTIAYEPKIVLFNLTTNDQAYWSMSEKDVLRMTNEYIQKVHSALPNCQFAMVNGSPLPGRSEMFATVERVNKAAKKYAETLDYVYYIDTYDFVYERMMEYPEGWEFWTHMETDTLSTWMNMIADGVQQIVDEKGIVF